MSKRLPFAPLVATIGLGFRLIVGSLVAPTRSHIRTQSVNCGSGLAREGARMTDRAFQGC